MELENKGDLETEIIESLQPIDECIVKNSNNRPKHGSKRSIIEKILKVRCSLVLAEPEFAERTDCISWVLFARPQAYAALIYNVKKKY
jgi:hypothetical protein